MKHMLLNGLWEYGSKRQYKNTGQVPGLVSEPRKINEDILWYRRKVFLPEGEWTHGTLILKGARFCPSIYVNEIKVSSKDGGMAPTYHPLSSEDIKPGETIELEIALQPLDAVMEDDASKIPDADLWRSNVASCLWDDVSLKCHGGAYIKRYIPYGNFKKDCVEVSLDLDLLDESIQSNELTMTCKVVDRAGNTIVENSQEISEETISFDLNGKCKPWCPENPYCYTLIMELTYRDMLMDREKTTIGLKSFEVEGIGFLLNNQPVTLRAGTVVWHRWLRDPEGETLAFNKEWFEKHVIQVLKKQGANTLRFHLGMPPESFLDLCDVYGLLVQAEWSFFHGMKGSEESLVKQWRNWIDLCMRHPSVALIHGWNETEEHLLKPALRAINRLKEEYPPIVVSHIDVIHIHKYWWSLFENIGLYYDSAKEFNKPIMVDEFGGNYLDGEGNFGEYPTVEEGMIRFLGRNHTKETRLQLQKDANGKIAEYWRRIGAAGYSPFCILGSPEDGSHHYMGKVSEGNLKPIWKALPTVYSPLSCSLEVWDKHYEPCQEIELPLYFFNDTHDDTVLKGRVQICSAHDRQDIKEEIVVLSETKSHSTSIHNISLTMPPTEGNWVILTILDNPPKNVTYPIVSEWYVCTHSLKIPTQLQDKAIGIAAAENELREFLTSIGLKVYDTINTSLDIIVGSKTTWEELMKDNKMRQLYHKRILEGCNIILLDVGPSQLYLPGHTEALDGIYTPSSYKHIDYELFSEIQVHFQQVPEPESCIQPISETKDRIWDGLNDDALWLCNGLRGGLNVPTWDMELSGLGKADLIKQWISRGADKILIQQPGYMAYELAGFFAFSTGNDDTVKEQLREKVRFLVEDAPALKGSIDTEAPIKTINISHELVKLNNNKAIKSVEALACCGKNLARTPAVQLEIGDKCGQLVLSQILTKGRLAKGYGNEGLYGIRKDVVMQQVVLNMMKHCVLRSNK